MHAPEARRALTAPERLFIYECRGPGLPRREPAHPHFLGIWSEPPHHYYLFFSEPASEWVADWVRGEKDWTLEGHYDLDYAQWQQLPCGEQRVGPFRILPPGQARVTPQARQDPDQGGMSLRIDPGLVFGSGLHPTTRGSLLAIAHCCTTRSIGSAIDFGTGTGILALACAACGVERVLAIDCNPMAVRAALRNAARNALEQRILGIAADSLRAISMHADLLAMNIEWPSLLQVLRDDGWVPHGAIVVSGFLRPFESEVVVGFTKPGLHRPVWRHEEDGWSTYVFVSGEGA